MKKAFSGLKKAFLNFGEIVYCAGSGSFSCIGTFCGM